MVFAKNEFDLLVNTYYQAYGILKEINQGVIFDEVELLPEIECFRNDLRNYPPLYKLLIQSDNNRQTGKFEIEIVKLKLSELFLVKDWWFQEIEQSVNNYLKGNSDIVSYRIVFQTASDNLYKFVGAVIPHMNPSINKEEAIIDVTNNILNKDYWQGEDVLKAINFSRFFRTRLGFSEKWIYEYMKNLLKN